MIGSAVAQNDPEKVDDIRRDFYIYESEALALAPAGNANDIINIEADSDFILQKFAFQADIAAAAYTRFTAPEPLVTIQLIDSGSGRQLMQNPIPVASFMGNGQLPFILPNPRKFLRNSTIQIAYNNFDAAVTYNIRLAFIGYKIYATA
jgi:hypothetical protein